jgi:hypothetical protein
MLSPPVSNADLARMVSAITSCAQPPPQHCAAISRKISEEARMTTLIETALREAFRALHSKADDDRATRY